MKTILKNKYFKTQKTKKMNLKFVIKKEPFSKKDGTQSISYYLYLESINNEIFYYCKIIDVFSDLESAKEFLDKIKDIYPDPDLKKEIIYQDDSNKVYINSENVINKSTLKIRRSYAIFNNYTCIKIIFDDYKNAVESAKSYVEKLNKVQEISINKPEIVFELIINK